MEGPYGMGAMGMKRDNLEKGPGPHPVELLDRPEHRSARLPVHNISPTGLGGDEGSPDLEVRLKGGWVEIFWPTAIKRKLRRLKH